VSLGVALAVAALIMAFLMATTHKKYPEAELPALILSSILVVMLLVALVWVLWIRRKDVSGAAWIIGGGMAAFAVWLAFGVAPFIANRESTYNLVHKIPVSTVTQLVEYNCPRPSLLYYLGRTPKHMDDASAVKRLLAGKSPVFVICKERALTQILTPGAIEYAKLGGRVVIANTAAFCLKGKVN
jgi:cytochrome bd-type quinol oxidase subunit 2